MTALAFMLGVLPLVLASDLGAHARAILGITVLGGMLAATTVAIAIIPVCFYVIERLTRWRKQRGPAGTGNLQMPQQEADDVP